MDTNKSKNFSQNMVLFMSICIQTFEIHSILEAFLTEEKVVAVLTHPAMLKDFSFASKTLVFFVLLHLRLEYYFQLMRRFVPLRRISSKPYRPLKVTFLT